VPYVWEQYKLWLDLQWWIELDYKVDLEKIRSEEDYNIQKENDAIEWLKSIIEKRIQSLNINDSVINDASYAWEKHIIVQIPMKSNTSFENKENIEKAKDAIWKVISISFQEKKDNITKEDLDFRGKISLELFEKLKKKNDFFISANEFKNKYERIDFWTVNNLAELNIIDKSILDINWLVNKIISWTKNNETWKYLINVNKDNNIYKINYIFIYDNPSEWTIAKVNNWKFLNEKYFINSSVSLNSLWKAEVELTFNSEWALIFWELSERLVWKQMAIFVWGELLTAPVIQTPIKNWRAVITWQESLESAQKLSQNINTWVVPAPIYLSSEKIIDSKLWLNSLEKLIFAWAIWFILILIFLVYFYRLSWLMSWIALFWYILIILSIVKAFSIVLTLASIAGLVLSIGMAIDANILIFERVREELKTSKSLLDSSAIWFKTSFSAIWDSNLTWFIVAIVLYVFWVNLIKGFGLMLWIWIFVSFFSSIFITRLLVFVLANFIKNKLMFIWK